MSSQAACLLSMTMRCTARCTTSDNGIIFGETRPVRGRQTPLLGEHNREKLAALGYSSAEIDGFYASGVLTTEEPAEE